MKMVTALFILLSAGGAFAQLDTTFTELRGMEDSTGQTHLFYRKHTFTSGPTSFYRHYDIYHLDLMGGTDTLFLKDYYEYWTYFEGGELVQDFEFWNNDPFQFIYGGAHLSLDPTAHISRWDTTDLFIWIGSVDNIEISRQDDSLLYASMGGDLLKSMNGGLVWDWVSPGHFFPMVALSPFNDQVLYAVVDFGDGQLNKSVDGGASSFLVDSSVSWIEQNTQLFFDKDSVHIYAITGTNFESNLLISGDAGDSWQVIIADSPVVHLAIDNSQLGNVFLSIGNEILFSNNYGSTFTPYWSLNRSVVGMYKKPQSNLLYAITAKTLYEITPADTQVIKQLSTVTGLIEPQPLVQDFKLFQNYPNPFNPTTIISYKLPVSSEVELKIYNLLGQKVRSLVNERKPAGFYQVQWDGRDETGKEVSSGVYIYRLKAGDFIQSKKMLLIR